MELQHAKFRERTFYWNEAGSKNKPLLIFLHGYPDSPSSWEFQVEKFKKDFHVICPFARETKLGKEKLAISSYGSNAHTLDLLETVKKIDPKGKSKIYLVGHDFGAAHSWNLAYALKDRLNAMVIINGLALNQMNKRYNRPKQFLKSWYIYPLLLPWVPEFITENFKTPLLNFAYQLGGLPKRLHPKSEANTDSITNPINQYRAFFKEAFTKEQRIARPVSAPVLVLWGKDDAFLLPPTEDEIRKDAPNLEIRILEGNHWLHREKPEEINLLIETFLRKQGAYAKLDQ